MNARLNPHRRVNGDETLIYTSSAGEAICSPPCVFSLLMCDYTASAGGPASAYSEETLQPGGLPSVPSACTLTRAEAGGPKQSPDSSLPVPLPIKIPVVC